MRLLSLLFLAVPAVVLSAACSAPSEVAEESVSGVSEIKGSNCSLSREKIISTAGPKRRRAIERGFQWLDDDVQYSTKGSHGGYRTDCSGFVSMCWELGKSVDSRSFYSGDSNEELGSWDELVPADALVRNGHVALFLAWNDSAKSSVCVIENTGKDRNVQFQVRSVASLKSQKYKPIRSTKLAGETGGSGSNSNKGETASDVDLPDTETEPTDDPATNDPETGTCKPASALKVCAQAKLFLGASCGSFDDGCGGVVNCTQMPGFGCAPNEVCEANVCVCVPMKAAEACAAAKTTAGVECGTVEDGCGGKVDCNDVRGFGCKEGSSCTAATNRCNTPGEKPKPDSHLEDGPIGDPGDDTKPNQKSEGNGDEPASKKGPKTASGGCSASPLDAGRGRGDAAWVIVGFAIAAGLRRSRRRSDRPE
jgi:hypothetical protein